MSFAARSSLALCILASAAMAQTTVQPTGRGNTLESPDFPGDSSTGDKPTDNYAVGGLEGTVVRDYFNFAIPEGNWTSATLELDEPSNGHAGGDVTLNLYSLPDAPSDGEITYAFASLGTGTFYGSVGLSSSDAGTTVDIALNATALADILSDAGGAATFNIAGVSTGESLGGLDFLNTGAAQSSVLILSDAAVAPEPGSIALMGLGLASLVGARFRRNRRG